MRRDLALRVLGTLLKWSDEEAEREFRWLRLMSRFKYDGYHEFLAGVRFLESLASWLQQFEPSDRQTAYDFVRKRLVYITSRELQRLVEAFYPRTVERGLRAAVADRLHIKPHLLWSTEAAARAYERTLQRTLFLGLSDGARLDLFRRANAGVISNEQVVLTTQIDTGKWHELRKGLQERVGPDARFAFAYLVDDFTGSGFTCLRQSSGAWAGKLVKFWKSTQSCATEVFDTDWSVCVHHYVGTEGAQKHLKDAEQKCRTDRGKEWFPRVDFSFGMVLSSDLKVTSEKDPGFVALTQKYYDASVENEHTRVGGTDVRLGFAGCALPVVLEHNTPNNSVALLWEESDGSEAHRMRPLFRRRQRHT